MLRIKSIMLLFGIAMCFFNSHNAMSETIDMKSKNDFKFYNVFNKEYRYITMNSVNEVGIQHYSDKWEVCYGEGVLANYFDDITFVSIKQKLIMCWNKIFDIFYNNALFIHFFDILYFRNVFAHILNLYLTNQIEYLLWHSGNYKILRQSKIIKCMYSYYRYNFYDRNKKSLVGIKNSSNQDYDKLPQPQSYCCLCNGAIFEKNIQKDQQDSHSATQIEQIRQLNQECIKKNENEQKDFINSISTTLNEIFFNTSNIVSSKPKSPFLDMECCHSKIHSECFETFYKKRGCCPECNEMVTYNAITQDINKLPYYMLINCYLFKQQITVEYSDINKIFFIMPFVRVSGIFLPTISIHPLFFFKKNTILCVKDFSNNFSFFLNLSIKIEGGFSYLNEHFISFYIKPTLCLFKDFFIDGGSWPISIHFGIEYFRNGKGTNSQI